jgi:hypothetical protein
MFERSQDNGWVMALPGEEMAVACVVRRCRYALVTR